ncbi:TPA: hypothetical protein N0F65_006572 [Lagenidium giganteum]|uniref:Carbonic anhydrase n=1 Tax=Lagenidium giganteum TaxID=4803 RepID=A0AAV2YGG9_9STRA|nr:TPA: hypothetical protein N0F65_006572 [Lagenidium giganteum]
MQNDVDSIQCIIENNKKWRHSMTQKGLQDMPACGGGSCGQHCGHQAHSYLEHTGSIHSLLANNQRWRNQKQEADSQFFERMAESQRPRYLWIGCSDSRVPAEEITGLHPGEMFVHRNVANLVVSNDINALAVVQFAVEKLHVRDIIVCGHYGCGGVRAAMDNQQLGLLDNWLRNIRDVCRLHWDELVAIKNSHARFNRLVELNIQEQCLNIFKINMVQRHQLNYGVPRIHGLVYNLKNGELKELDIDYQGYLDRYSGIYRLHSFPSDGIPEERWQLQRNLMTNLIEGHEEDNDHVSVRYLERMMRREKTMFTDAEIRECIGRARQEEGDSASPFVKIAVVLSFFSAVTESTESTESSESAV